MKLHTSLTPVEVTQALGRAQNKGRITRDVHFTVFIPERSLTHRYGYEIQLGTYDQDSLPAGYADQNGRTMRVRRARGANQGDARWAATWHEWGWFIAEVFAADPGARWGSDPARSRHPWGYFSPADFHGKTGGQFQLRNAHTCGRHCGPGYHPDAVTVRLIENHERSQRPAPARPSADDQAAKLQAGYDAARERYGGSYAGYLIRHDRELAARGRTPRPWPLSILGNNGD